VHQGRSLLSTIALLVFVAQTYHERQNRRLQLGVLQLQKKSRDCRHFFDYQDAFDVFVFEIQKFKI